MYEYTKTAQQRAFLITLQYPETTKKEAETHLNELAHLCKTASLQICDQKIVSLKYPHSRLLLGSGKTSEMVEAAREAQADMIVFDDDLTPAQQRNWEQTAKLTVIDRREVILEIFSLHAGTKESSLQVELAQLEYSLPRLKRAWTHLSRQRGGAKGTRGEGETQLEMDRRRVEARITKVKKELLSLTRNRATQRKQRKSVPVPTGSFVGYTNAGKSSLLNILTGSHVLVEDKLFATLDPTTRKISLAGIGRVLMTDTVGFIRKLPHTLVNAFHSTLEETLLSDFLVHVLDAANPEVDEQYATTLKVLKELSADEKPIITVFNKVDSCKDSMHLEMLRLKYPDALFVSAKTGEGLEELVKTIGLTASRNLAITNFSLPTNRYDIVAYLYRTGNVISERHVDHRIELIAEVNSKIQNQLHRFVINS